MKKSVRIRKATEGEKPGYYNKTSRFLTKAQMGMSVASPTMDPARLNKVFENAYYSLRNSMDPETLYDNLISSYALDQQTALSIIQSAIVKLSEEGYFDSQKIKDQQQQEQDPNVDQSQQNAEAAQQRASDDAEMEDLANSSEGYYDEEEAANNTNTQLETEEDQQMQAFGRYGGYMQNGGENETKNTIIDQYNYPGQDTQEKPFSLDELIALTPGTQNMVFPDLSYYIGNNMYDLYDQTDLPQAADGGISKLLKSPLLTQGPGYPKKFVPMTNMSTFRKMVPLATMTGQGITQLPWLGSKFTPQLKTTFTQNRDELWKMLHGDASPKTGIFSYNGTLTGGGDGSVNVDRLQLYQDDVFNIINTLERGNKSFSLDQLGSLNAETDGLIGGVYPLNSKVIGGVDDSGNKFFELTHKFGPNQKLPFGSTSSKAKELTFKNRFYYTIDPETGGINVLDQMGNPLTQGSKSKSIVNPPFLGGLTTNIRDVSLRDSSTPFPKSDVPYMLQKDSDNLYSYITETPPTPYSKLGTRGKIYRIGETYATTGLNQLFRTGLSGIRSVDMPTFGYVNPALGANVINPAAEGSYANDIKNALNYKYRIGRNALLGTGALGYAGYKTWDALYNQCQCEDPTANNYQPLDEYGNCPCNTDVGPIRTLDPSGVEFNKQIDQKDLTFPDSMQFLIQRGIAPTPYNYYRYKDSTLSNPNVDINMPDDDFKYGGISKSKFIKDFTKKFQEGGEEKEVGKGKRTDDLTNTVENKKNIFKSTLKNNSNKAITEEIYENAKYNPQILNLLTKDGYQENLANNNQMQPQADFGGFVDMDAENPLTKFIYGGNESEYYEPYGLPEAQDGMNFMNQAGDYRTMSNKLAFQDWAEGEREDFAQTHPGVDFDTWKAEEAAQKDYQNYEDFYDKTAKEYLNYGDEALDETDDTPLNQTNNITSKKCGPGTVWNDKYNRCINVASINFVPREVRPNPTFRNTYLPWNPLISNMGTYAQPQGKPYFLDTKNPFTGQLPPEVAARYVTKRGLGGKEKKWLDIYQVAGDNPIDVSQIKQMVDPERERRNRNEKPESRERNERQERVSRNEYIDSKLLEDSWNKKHWDDLSNAEKRHARTTYAFENEDARRFRDKVRFGAQGSGYYEDKSKKRVKDKKQFGGVYRYGGISSFDLGSGFSNGVGQDMSAFEPYSADAQFQNSLFGSQRPSSTPQQQNPFAFINPTGTGSYAETANTGHTLGSQGQEIIPQETPSAPNQYVAVENKRKKMQSVDPEAAVNVFNAGARGILGKINNFRNRKDERNLQLDIAATENQVQPMYTTDYGDIVDVGYLGFQTPQQGQDQSGRSSFGTANIGRYGGYMQYGGFQDPYEVDEEVYMTPEELEQFLASGGQVEYL